MCDNTRKSLTQNIKDALLYSKVLCKWLLLGGVVGLIVGAVASLFGHALIAVNDFRGAQPWVVYLLPLGGLAIAFVYHKFGSGDRGTNTIIASVNSGAKVPLRMAPMIFLSTVITHLCGGSAGREGAALQLGGSISGKLGDVLRLKDSERTIMIMCGMSAGFSALFGTPLAAAVFSLEVASVGIMQYSALVPCVTAALAAHFVAVWMQVPPEAFPVATIPEMTPGMFLVTVVFAVAAGAVSILFCVMLHRGEHLCRKYLKDPYVRVFAGGCLLAALASVPGMRMYLGSGIGIIEEILHHGGRVVPWAFLLKMVFTALTLGAGFKGGEIVPSFAIGAAFGCAVAALTRLPMELVAACGMAGVFCGVTNSPITALLVAFELFGFEAMPYYLVTVAVSYMISGRFGLYHEQRLMYSKTELTFINTTTR